MDYVCYNAKRNCEYVYVKMEFVYYDAKRNLKISTLKWSMSAMM